MLSAGVLDVRDVMNVLIALKKPLEVQMSYSYHDVDWKEEILLPMSSTR